MCRNRRARAAVAAAAAAFAVVCSASVGTGAWAAETDPTAPTSTTTTTTTKPPATAPPTTAPTTPTTPPTTAPAPQAPGAPVPTVPPSPIAQVQIEQQQQLATLQKQADDLATSVVRARADLGEIDVAVEDIQNRIGDVLKKIEERRAVLAKRAVAAYKGDYGYVSVLLDAQSPSEFLNRVKFLERTSDKDQDTIQRLLDEKADLDQQEQDMSRLQVQQREKVAELQAQQKDLGGKLGQMADVLSQLPQQQAIIVNGFVFPTSAPFTFSNDYGNYRVGPPVHGHQGNDIFCVWGSPLRAVEDGTITKLGRNGLGGERIWLSADRANPDGTHYAYYYAHLSGYYPGLTVGSHVKAGDFVGFCGNTGNAATTPPHTHFEIHPRGADGPSTNPYPTLRATQLAMEQAQQQLASMGTAASAPVQVDGAGNPIGIKAQPGTPVSTPATVTTPSGGTRAGDKPPVVAPPKRNAY
ncbi:MAG: peptidoglycan DD-metalloendopeptidase family protein [Acidimicrobiia bacterium]|nr:peptidoglycan DD-metalloendopeptidase family protein [Acidimicrobiia bacterium]